MATIGSGEKVSENMRKRQYAEWWACARFPLCLSFILLLWGMLHFFVALQVASAMKYPLYDYEANVNCTQGLFSDPAYWAGGVDVVARQ